MKHTWTIADGRRTARHWGSVVAAWQNTLRQQ